MLYQKKNQIYISLYYHVLISGLPLLVWGVPNTVLYPDYNARRSCDAWLRMALKQMA